MTATVEPEANVAPPTIEELTINTIRTLSMDAVQKANSGHPGTPMALAPLMYTLWQDYLQYDPADPLWPNRDRFVLSIGHASMLLYSMLHLAGVRRVGENYTILDAPAVSLDDIKQFRQLGSVTPGHPEYHLTTGVESTTGPLGQGIAMSVGMAIAERWLAARYNRPDATVIDYDVYAFCGDGDMMEGVSHEAASLAGHLKLSNLCWIYDNNHISIEGPTSLAFSDDVATRFLGYHWNVLHVGDVNDRYWLRRAFDTFKKTTDRPTLIIVDSHIGYGSPHKQDSREAHGEALGADEVKLTKRVYGWPEDAQFLVPDGVMEHLADGLGARGREQHREWDAVMADYAKAYAPMAEEFRRMERRELPDGWDANLPTFPADAKGIATRDSSGKVLNQLAQNVPWLLGGSADLWPSTKTNLTFKDAGTFEADDHSGRNFHFGIREFGMAAACNGMALSKLRAYGSTFLIFSDYCKPAIRLSAIMEVPTIYIFTHDSIGVGEDGPTHQPIEQLAQLRAMPGILVIRPCDANEVVSAWRTIMPLKHEPVALALTRQALPTIDRTKYAAPDVARGAYVLADPPAGQGAPQVVLIGTGSEVSLCLAAHEQLAKEGIRSRVVSMPCSELFDRQTTEYRESVLPKSVTARVAVEMASTFGWERYVGINGAVIGMTTFGASAPIAALLKHFGFTVDHVVQAAHAQLGR
jgi:transketolase